MSNRPTVMIEGSKSFYRASAVGQCQRALAAQRMGMDPLGPSADMQRRFKDGHLHEQSILEAIEEQTGQAIVRQQEEWTVEISPTITVVGHVDGITSDDLIPVEAKSASKDAFADWKAGAEEWFDGRHGSYRLGYADQWSLTLHAYGVSEGLYGVKNKNSGEVLTRRIGVPSSLQEIQLRLLRIDLDGRRGKLPDCDRFDSFFCSLRYLHDDQGPKKGVTAAGVDEVGDETLEALGKAHLEAQEAEKRAVAVRKELGSRLVEAMGDRDKALCETCVVTKVVGRVTRTLDREKLSEVVGELTPFENVRVGDPYILVKPATQKEG